MMPAFDPSSFDPDFAGPADWAAMYRAHGLQVVPGKPPKRGAAWKSPAIEWRPLVDEFASDLTFERWYGDDGTFIRNNNMGVVCGRASNHVFVLDLDDHKKPEAKLWWDALIGLHNYGADPETWQQKTGGGGRQLLFRASADWRPPTNRTAIGVDVRGQGGFAVLPPSWHADTGKQYEWAQGCAPWDLPDGPAKAPQWLLDAIDALVVEHGGQAGQTAPERTSSPSSDYDAFGKLQDGREDYMTRVVWGAVVDWWRECPIQPPQAENEAKCAEVYAIYERGVKSRHTGPDKTADLEREGRGPTLFGEKWRRAVRLWDTKVAEAGRQAPARLPAAEAPVEQQQVSLPEGGIHATPFPWTDPSSIPPREWVYGRHYVRRFVSTTVAPGGVGKSSLEIVELLAIASGKPLLGVLPDERCNTWYWNGEDPMDELKRRVMAAALHFGMSPDDLKGRFFVDTGRAAPIVVAQKTRDGVIINAPIVDAVIATIQANRIGVLSIDPFVACHRVTENDNAEIERVAKVWTHVADITGCSVELVHHVRKTNGNEVSVEDGRGAVALLAAARAARAINRMTADEAAKAGVLDPSFYFRADNGKANLAPPTATSWFHLVGVDLHNDTAMTATSPARPSDKVGVVEAWQWPDFSIGVTGSDVEEVQRRLRASSTRYRADAQANDWVGNLIISVLGTDPNDPASRAQAKSLQKTWLGTKALRLVEGVDERRRPKQFVEAGE